jgi:uridylate kinase
LEDIDKVFLIVNYILVMVVIKIGGSVIFDDSMNIDENTLESIIRSIERHSNLIRGIVVGGGEIARQYINFGKRFDMKDKDLDNLGITATRSNARFFQSILSTNYTFTKQIPNSVENDRFIMGGTSPGHTTDAVSVMLASRLKCDKVYVASDIDGIYDTRNSTIDDSEKLDCADTSTIIKILKDTSNSPGRSVPIDRDAVEMIRNNEIKLRLFNGNNTDSLEKVINGKEIGTLVKN